MVPILDPTLFRKYITELRSPILLEPDECILTDKCKKIPRYTIKMVQATHKLHPDLPATTLWTYNGELAPLLIENIRNHPIQVKWINSLPTKHLLQVYIDHTIPGAGFDVPDVRNVVHLHGGEQTSFSDGGPLEWFVPGQSVVYDYPNKQLSCMLFWHDHAIGITRLNAYAGLSGGVFMIRDPKVDFELNLPNKRFEIPLVITDKTFSLDGQIVYSTMPSNPSVHPKWASHFLGNTILVNNTIWPFVNVEPNKYRLRIVISSDTRTYALKLVDATDFTKPGPIFTQIGTDGGFLPKPVPITGFLLLGIGERADIIVDFSSYAPGTEFIMINTAKAPFPGGKDPDPATVGQIMKFVVVPSTTDKMFCTDVPKHFISLNPKDVSHTRQLILQTSPIMGQTMPAALYLNNTAFMNPVTETPILGSTELWEFINITDGMHPMHIHLIQFQLLNRQAFDVTKYTNDLLAINPGLVPGNGINVLDVAPYLQGEPISPIGTNEYGWKDVIQASNGFVTRILVKFAPQQPGTRFPFDATRGQYVWHCHIISHEDNDMMRPYQLFYKNPGITKSIAECECHKGKRTYLADFVIIGSGPGGATLANKLSAAGSSVVLLEAGGYHDKDSLIADSFNCNLLPMNYTNQYFIANGQTIPQVNVNDNTFDYMQGRLLGGSSSINGMQYVRGSSHIFELWEKITGDKSYSPKNINRIYNELEKFNGSSTTVRGDSGPVNIRLAPKYPTLMAEKFVNGISTTTGYPKIVDYNDPSTPLGPFTQWQLYQHDDGSRVSSSTAYLDPIIDVTNDGKFGFGTDKYCGLLVLIKATALNIIWKGNSATGVRALHDGELIKVKCRKKVIVSAGIMTPVFLLRSGIGPKEDLAEVGIDVVYDNPNVGAHLENQTIISVTASANPDDVGTPNPNDLYVGGAFLPDPSMPGSTTRAIQLIGMSMVQQFFNIIIAPVQPKSRGNIKIYSKDPLQVPVIDTGYFTDDHDIQTMEAAIKQANDIINNMGDPKYKLINPDPSILDDPQQLQNFIKGNLSQTHHWVCSCRMSDNEKDGVVDPNGNVFGVSNLMVCDATCFPHQSDGNTSAPVYALANVIAEKLTNPCACKKLK
ncbi:MAG: copper oxidase [Satyrvirus sp.]|uniref:Copper oxidase n=1 Tax=Satyrvirus sp. TaxID=2487771 RepID=A0A3G5AHN9_9VIRU|nr:MAG: copper oxidase [Satyrvirus sp.]